jgi:hypothetical protein
MGSRLPDEPPPPGAPALALIPVLAEAVTGLPDQIRHLQMKNEAGRIERGGLARNIAADAPCGGMAMTWCLKYRSPRKHALPVAVGLLRGRV